MYASPWAVLVPTAFGLGLVAGFVMHRGDFCIAGMFRDFFLFRRTAPLKALFLLIVLSMAAFEAARLLGGLGTYPFPLLGPASLVNVLGGAAFGLGMVLAGGCVVGTLYKLGAGSALSLVALAGLIAGSALYAEIHSTWSSLARGTGLAGDAITVPAALGLPPWSLILPLLIVGALLVYRWARAGAFRRRVVPAGYLQPWQVAGLLATVGLLSYVLVGMPLGITTAYAKTGAYVEALLVPEHVASTPYFQSEPLRYVPPFSDTEVAGGPGPRLDAIAALQFPLILGIILGATVSALRLGEFRIHLRLPPRQYLSALLGGLIMGLAARMAPACNVWHLLGGVPILAIQSLLFVAGLLPGAWLGSRLVTRWVFR